MTWERKLKTEVDYPFRLDNQPGPAYFSVARLPRVVAGFTLRPGGFSTGPFAAANLGWRIGDQESQVRRNREALLAKLGGGAFRSLVTVRQVHGHRCFTVGGGQVSGDLGQIEADVLVTAEPGILLGVLTADCLPLILVD
ncbi:MAG: laccase domain-containing protein, partial [Deltaproteobacteria bacterium]|nr:laccase domain-containing protein [Deltaproteobacteria bacterium]